MPNVFVDNTVRLKLSIGQYTGQKLDRKTTEKVAQDAGAKGEAGRYYKQLVSCPELKDYQRNSDQARIYLYENTLPWDDGGVRILTNPMFFDVAEKLGEFKEEAARLAEKFCEYYADKLDREKARLGSLFDPIDYPDVEVVRKKFYFSIDFEPMSDVGDFRIKLTDEWEEELKERHEARLEKVHALAMRELWERLYGVVEHLHERLSDPDKIFRNSIISNIQELVDLLPNLNVMQDTDLDKMTSEVRKSLAGLNPENLRNNRKLRSSTATDADKIMKKINSYMSAFQQAA